jgi:transposase
VSLLGDFLRSTLSWWRRVKISASSDDLDRNNPMTAHQISLRMSPIGASIARFAAIRQLDRVYGSDRRKIHALVDTEGLPLRAVVHSAGIQDRDGAGLVLDKIRNRFPWLELVWADNGYNAWQIEAAVAKVPVLRIEIVKRSDDLKGFVVLPRRWVVERTFSWFGRNRRIAKDYENLGLTLAAFVTLACIQIAVRRLAR